MFQYLNGPKRSQGFRSPTPFVRQFDQFSFSAAAPPPPMGQ